VDISVSNSVLTLMGTNRFTISVSPTNLVPSEYRVQLARTEKVNGAYDWHTVGQIPVPSALNIARVAGHFKARAGACINGEWIYSGDSGAKDIEVRFPTVANFINHPHLQSHFETMWLWSLSVANSNTVQETGCWITLDTATGQYGILNRVNGDPYPVNSTTVYLNTLLPQRPLDSPSSVNPGGSAVYVIGWFHTHPPRECWLVDTPVGPSRGMNADQGFPHHSNVLAPGIVYDYVEYDSGAAFSPLPPGYVPAKWPRDKPRMLYPITGPRRGPHLERRPTP